MKLKKVTCMSLAALTLAGTGVAVNTVSNPVSVQAKEKPITFTFFNGFPSANQFKPDTPVAKQITKETGVTIKTEYVVGDLETKVGVMIASGQYPDFIYGNGSHQKFVDAGACRPLNDYIDKYGTNIKKVYKKMMKRIKQKDGNIYFLPPYAEQIDVTTPGRGFYVQKRVLKEFGYPKLKTLDEYFNLLQKYKKKHPTTDGKPTIGFTAYAGDSGANIWTITNASSDLRGYPNDGGFQIDPKTYKAKDFSVNSDSKAYYKKLNDLYHNGFLDKELFSSNKDQYLAKISDGRVLGLYDQNWDFNNAQISLKTNKKFDRTYVCFPIVWDKSVQDYYVYPSAPVVRDGISISKDCKDPVRAFKFLDYILSEKTQKLTNWGIKGKDYNVDKKGHFTQTAALIVKTNDTEYQKKEGIGQFGYPWPVNSGNAKFSDGNQWQPKYDPDIAAANYNDSDREVLKAYGVKNYDDMFTIQKLRPWGEAWDVSLPTGSDESIKNTKLSDLLKLYCAKLVLADSNKFESVWKDFVKEHSKIKFETVEKYVTTQIRWRIKNWTDLPVPKY